MLNVSGCIVLSCNGDTISQHTTDIKRFNTRTYAGIPRQESDNWRFCDEISICIANVVTVMAKGSPKRCNQ